MDASTGGKRTHRRDKVVRRFFLVLFGLALLALAAPTIIGMTGMQNWALARALPAKAGKLTAREASLGWFTATRLRGVELRDPQGAVVARIDSLAIDRSLGQLATGTDIGRVRLNEPVVYAVVAPNGYSNVEALIAAMDDRDDLTDEDDPNTGQESPIELEITGATIAVTDAATGETVVHDQINAHVTLDDNGLKTLTAEGLSLAAIIPAGAQPPRLPLENRANPQAGRFNVSLGANNAGLQEAKFALANLDLHALAPWLRRVDPAMRIAGVAQGEGVAVWRNSSPPRQRGKLAQAPAPGQAGSLSYTGLQTSGRVQVAGFRFTSSVTNGDVIPIESFDLPWRLTALPDGRLQIDQAGLQSDFATATATGTLTPAEMAALAEGRWLTPGALSVNAELDLAKLARVAPSALHLRRGVSITSGQVRLAANASPLPRIGPEARKLVAQIETANLTAMRGDRPIAIDDLLRVSLDVDQTPDALTINRMTLDAPFASGELAGDAAEMTGDFTFDLDRLMTEVEPLLDLEGWRVSGKGIGKFTWAKVPDTRFRATGEATIAGCVVSHNDDPVVQERQLRIELTGDGALDPATKAVASLAAGQFTATAGDDRLRVELTQPVNLDAPAYPMTVRLVGDMNAWRRRLSIATMSFATEDALLANLTAAGQVDASAAGQFGAERVQIDTLRVDATDLRLATGAWDIREPKLQLTGDALWDAATGSIASRTGQLVTSSMSLAARNLQAQLGGAASGELAVRADLARVASWRPLLMQTHRAKGELAGAVRLRGQAGKLTADVNLTGTDLALAELHSNGVPTLVWSEPRLTLTGAVLHDGPNDRVALNGLKITSDTLAANVTGGVERLSADGAAQLSGTVDYDLAQLSAVLGPALGPGVQLSGRRQANFQLAGALNLPNAANAHWSQRWTGNLRAPWQAMSLYGLPISEGTLVATLAAGHVRCEPLVLGVGTQGRMTVQPMVRLDPEPQEWGLPPGPIVENVYITPAVSEQMLKYIAPFFAGATRSEGSFSLRTEGVRARLDDASSLETTGQLDLAQVRVVTGPGVQSWVDLTRQVEALIKSRDPSVLTQRPAPTLLSISQRTVNFRVAQGRVYHEGLEFDLAETRVRSNGSVGFDESLDIILTVPIQDRWIQGERLLVGLRGQAVQIPVRGTLSRPNIDERALRNLSQQMIQSGVQGAIQGELSRQLEKLFGG